MKRCLLALLLFCFSVSAQNLAWMANQANGKIIITDEVCKIGGKTYNALYRVFMYTEEGYTLNGCYMLSEELVEVVWENNQERKYPISSFTLYQRSKGTKL